MFQRVFFSATPLALPSKSHLTLFPVPPHPCSFDAFETTANRTAPAAAAYEDGYLASRVGVVDADTAAAEWATLGGPAIDGRPVSVHQASLPDEPDGRPRLAPVTEGEIGGILMRATTFFGVGKKGKKLNDVSRDEFSQLLAKPVPAHTLAAAAGEPARPPDFYITMAIVVRELCRGNTRRIQAWFPPVPKTGADELTIAFHENGIKTKASRRIDAAKYELEKAGAPATAGTLYPFFIDLLPLVFKEPEKLMGWLTRYARHY